MVLVQDLREAGHLTAHVVEHYIEFRYVVLARFAFPLLDLIIMVTVISFFESCSILVLLTDSNLFKQFVLICVHVRDPPNQRQCLRDIPYFLLYISIHLLANVVHDLGDTLVVDVLRRCLIAYRLFGISVIAAT